MGSAPIIKRIPRPIKAGIVILAFFILAGGLWWVYTYPPGTSPVQIPCVFYAFTGFYCAGCGITRAVYLTLHGHLWAAFKMNALVGLMVVGGLIWAITAVAAKLRHRLVPVPPAWVWLTLAGAILVFMILRNIPMFPFTLLAPTLLP